MTDSTQANTIRSFLSNKAELHWIGLTDVQSEGLFVWSGSQTNVTWTNWAPGEPNRGIIENCGVTEQSARWRDTPCSGNDYFALCQFCK